MTCTERGERACRGRTLRFSREGERGESESQRWPHVTLRTKSLPAAGTSLRPEARKHLERPGHLPSSWGRGAALCSGLCWLSGLRTALGGFCLKLLAQQASGRPAH